MVYVTKTYPRAIVLGGFDEERVGLVVAGRQGPVHAYGRRVQGYGLLAAPIGCPGDLRADYARRVLDYFGVGR